MIKIALVDDHAMLRKALADMLISNGFEVLFEANNGKECIEKIDTKNLPDIILMDINMPLMSGFETTQWLKKNIPSIKVLALSMYDEEDTIIKMFRAGACGYMIKDNEPEDLIKALEIIHSEGFYSNDILSINVVKALNSENSNKKISSNADKLSQKEIEFLKHCCTEMAYKEIATCMNVSQRTVDGYRESLFDKLKVHTRIGLAVYAIRKGIIKI